jgi:hypothetical protein
VEAQQEIATGGSGREKILRRRRWLYASALLALIAVAVAIGFSLLGGSDRKTAAAKNAASAPPIVLERIELKPVAGQSGHGLAELVRRPKSDALRVLAVKLRPSLAGEVYQLLLTGGSGGTKLLGNEVIGQNKTFIGEAKISANDMHRYSRIELRRVSEADPPVEKLVLRGSIPR